MGAVSVRRRITGAARLAVLLAVAVALAFGTVCGAAAADLEAVSELLVRMENAYNSRNAANVLQCIEPLAAGESETARMVRSFMGDPSGKGWPKCRLTPISYKGGNNRGTLQFHTRLRHADGSEEHFEEEITVTRLGGVWFIAADQNRTEAPEDEPEEEETGPEEAEPPEGNPEGEPEEAEPEPEVMEIEMVSLHAVTAEPDVELRAFPQEESDTVLRIAGKGTEVRIVGRYTDRDGLCWYQAETEDGTGFVPGSLLNLDED